MSKRSADDQKPSGSVITGYLHSISDVKTSKNNNRYFEGKIQTEQKQVQRLVVFTPDKHENYRSAASLGKAVKLTNATMTPNRNDIEVHVNRKTTMEVHQEPLAFRRKLFTDDAPAATTSTSSVTEMNISDFKEPYQMGTVLVKVLNNNKDEEEVDFGWGKKKKKVITIGDKTGCMELNLYENLIKQVENEKSYKISNVSSRKYNNDIYLTTTMKSSIELIQNIPDVEQPTPIEKITSKVEVHECRLSVSYKCNNCKKGIDIENEDAKLVKCQICKMSQRKDKLNNSSYMLLNVTTTDEAPKQLKMIIFHSVISEHFKAIGQSMIVEELEEYFLMQQYFTIEYMPNTDVILKLTSN